MEQNKLCNAVKRIGLAYLFIHIHINIGTIDILPDWLGYLWIFNALLVITEEIPTAKLLRPLGMVLTIWTFISWLLAVFGMDLEIILGYLGPIEDVLGTVIHLYFHFQLLTDLARLATKYQCPSDRVLLTLRTIRTVIHTVFALQLPWESSDVVYWIYMGITVVYIFAALLICVRLFTLREELWTRLQEKPEIG